MSEAVVEMSVEEIVQRLHQKVEEADFSRGQAILLAGALMAKDYRRYMKEMEEGLREKLMEHWGESRARAFHALAQAFAILLTRDEEGKFIELFAQAVTRRPSSGMDRYARVLRAVEAWAQALGQAEEAERAKALQSLLEAWRDLPYDAFRAATARSDREEAETDVSHLPFRAVFRIYPIGPDGVRAPRPIDVVVRWSDPSHEPIAQRVVALLQRFAEDLGNVQLRDPGPGAGADGL